MAYLFEFCKVCICWCSFAASCWKYSCENSSEQKIKWIIQKFTKTMLMFKKIERTIETILTWELTSITGAVPEVLAEAFLYLSIVDLTLIQMIYLLSNKFKLWLISQFHLCARMSKLCVAWLEFNMLKRKSSNFQNPLKINILLELLYTDCKVSIGTFRYFYLELFF